MQCIQYTVRFTLYTVHCTQYTVHTVNCTLYSVHSHLSVTVAQQSHVLLIGTKPNLYCEAIELVYGGSPKICVLVEWKAQAQAQVNSHG